MTAAELMGKLEALGKRIQTATSGEKWGAVAELLAEQAAVTKQHERALEAERVAAAAAKQHSEAEAKAALLERARALQAQWLAWLGDCDTVDAQAAALWGRYGEIMADYTRIASDMATLGIYGEVGADVWAIGSLSGAAARAKANQGENFLRWAGR